MEMRTRSVCLAMACAAMFASSATAADDDSRLAVTIWGLSYHVDTAIDYEPNN